MARTEKPVMTESSHHRRRSARAFERAQKVLVGGVNSPVRAFRAVGGDPLIIDRGEGAYLFDVDGNRYVDLVCSWGATILGHAHPIVVDAVTKAAGQGLSFGACCSAEAELAEIIVSAFPAIEMVRLVNSGTEATMSAIRLARAATKRAKILKFEGCYHGHVDSLLVSAGSGAATLGVPDSAGVPAEFAETTLLAPYNNLAAVVDVMERYSDQIAAIIVEPIAGNMGFVEPVDGFLTGLRELCDKHGSLLIFDEVMTGFRVAWGGCQTLWNIRPDITCLGKVIGGGMPLAAYGARRELMELVSPLGPMYQAGTLSGNPVAVAAGIATLKACARDAVGKGERGSTPLNPPLLRGEAGRMHSGFYAQLGAASKALADGVRAAGKEARIAVQAGSCGGLWGFTFSEETVRNFDDAKRADHALYARFFHAMLEEGVFLPPSGYEAMFVSAAHNEETITEVLSAAQEAFASVRP
jgi:glutamate-1-semialdehyde 2,1-aminomutase